MRNDRTVDRCRLCSGIAEGLAYLHGKGIASTIPHSSLNIGPNTIILNLGAWRSQGGDAQLTDFGNAILVDGLLRFTERGSTRSKLSTRWAAPEQLKGEVTYTVEADIHSLGMAEWSTHATFCAQETTSSQLPYADIKLEYAVALGIIEGRRPKRPENTIPTGSEQGNMLWFLFEACWRQDPSERPTAPFVVEVVSIRQSLDSVLKFMSSLDQEDQA
ncbi:hypothetical protein FRC12_011927 [Ceratobasidium sp. 428]|nr:hypothetical protein FRC12_011927 [Ceratobasidium sp. 428]